MRELRIQFISANVLLQQSGSYFGWSRRDRFLRNWGSRDRLSVPHGNPGRGLDTDEGYQVTCERPTPIEQSVVPVKFRVMDRVSFALKSVSQITVSR